MVAMTPLDINFLMRSMGLFSIFCARSRITMLAGNSILFPLLLMGYLHNLHTSNERNAKASILLIIRASPVSDLSDHIQVTRLSPSGDLPPHSEPHQAESS